MILIVTPFYGVTHVSERAHKGTGSKAQATRKAGAKHGAARER
jgi:hypothetical protein